MNNVMFVQHSENVAYQFQENILMKQKVVGTLPSLDTEMWKSFTYLSWLERIGALGFIKFTFLKKIFFPFFKFFCPLGRDWTGGL